MIYLYSEDSYLWDTLIFRVGHSRSTYNLIVFDVTGFEFCTSLLLQVPLFMHTSIFYQLTNTKKVKYKTDIMTVISKKEMFNEKFFSLKKK